MAIQFGREICGNLDVATQQEWLVTNSIGGYASGTVSGLLTRRYHGLLVAALKPPVQRTLLLTKLDETASYLNQLYPLHTNRWANGNVNPDGYLQIESFHLEGTTPVWTFACADALIEKRVWMQPYENTTYIRYSLVRGSSCLTLLLKALVNYRDHHSETHCHDLPMQVTPVEHGLCISPYAEASNFYLLSRMQLEQGSITPVHDWYLGFDLAMERYRGLVDREDHLHIATFTMKLDVGESFTIVASTQPNPQLDGQAALATRHQYEQNLMEKWRSAKYLETQQAPMWIQHLVLAADQFVVNRAIAAQPDGKSIIAGYHWFNDWGRDTMISLAGLTIATGRPEIARLILSTFALYLDQGMLPNVFPDDGETPEYNTVDAILWYFEAIRAYHAATADDSLLHELYPKLAEVIDWHCRGTRYNIHRDPEDGLIYAGETGVQLTWMDAKIGNWVITPRIGKPVEINALWYNALAIMTAIAQHLGKPYQEYEKMALQTAKGFQRFWNDELAYCYDVIDTPNGNHDDALRPNQIFAVSLPCSELLQTVPQLPPLLTPEQQHSVVQTCSRTLLTSHGLRSLAPKHLQYRGCYCGDSYQRDSIYHQGTTWGWLIGAFVQAHLYVYKDPLQAQRLLAPMANHLHAGGVGSLSEIFDGDVPMNPRGCIAQAWTVAEVLRTWLLVEKYKMS